MTLTPCPSTPTPGCPPTTRAAPYGDPNVKLPCLWCGDEEATTAVDVSDGISLTCSACDHEFTAAQAADRLEKLNKDWSAVLAWLATHPARGGRAKA